MMFAIGLLICASPLVLWLVLYFADPRSQLDLTVKIARMRKLRWISYIAGVALWLFFLFEHPFGRYWNLGFAVISASVGLEIPMGWLKNRLARYAKQVSHTPDAVLHQG